MSGEAVGLPPKAAERRHASAHGFSSYYREMRARPSVWVQIPGRRSTTRMYARPFEFCQRTVNGEVVVFGRYVPEWEVA